MYRKIKEIENVNNKKRLNSQEGFEGLLYRVITCF